MARSCTFAEVHWPGAILQSQLLCVLSDDFILLVAVKAAVGFLQEQQLLQTHLAWVLPQCSCAGGSVAA